MDSYILISAILLALQENSRPELGVVTFPFMLHRKAVCFVLRVKAPTGTLSSLAPYWPVLKAQITTKSLQASG